jgi:hypothetical protein
MRLRCLVALAFIVVAGPATLEAVRQAQAEAATTRPVKSLKVVPASGPLAGKQLYTNSHALLIGINRYQHLPKDKWLSYAERDATGLREVLIRSYGFLAEKCACSSTSRRRGGTSKTRSPHSPMTRWSERMIACWSPFPGTGKR